MQCHPGRNGRLVLRTGEGARHTIKGFRTRQRRIGQRRQAFPGAAKQWELSRFPPPGGIIPAFGPFSQAGVALDERDELGSAAGLQPLGFCLFPGFADALPVLLLAGQVPRLIEIAPGMVGLFPEQAAKPVVACLTSGVEIRCGWDNPVKTLFGSLAG